MNDMPDANDLLSDSQARREAEMDLPKFWNAERLILREQPRDPEVRRAFLQTYSGQTPCFDMLAIIARLRLSHEKGWFPKESSFLYCEKSPGPQRTGLKEADSALGKP